MHGTRGTTGSEGCLLLCSAVVNSLIFPISFALLPKFDAGKPGSETGINLKAGMQLKYMGSKSSTCGPAAGGRRCASLSLIRLWKAGVLPRNPASGPEGARRRRLRARRKPAPLLLEARPGLPALLAAPGRVQGRQALLLQSPPAGHSERPRRAPGCLLIRPAAQQLLGKVGLLHTAAATGAEQRAAYAAATTQCDRAMSGRTGLSTRSAPAGLSVVGNLQLELRLPVLCQKGIVQSWRVGSPRQAIYADPPYIFPGRRNLKQSCCQRRIEAAILCPTQDCQARARPAPGPHRPRSRTASPARRGASCAASSALRRFLHAMWRRAWGPGSLPLRLQPLRGSSRSGRPRSNKKDLSERCFRLILDPQLFKK